MSSDYSIEAVKRTNRNKQKQSMEAMGSANAARSSAQPAAIAVQQSQAARPNDSVQLSDEVKEVSKTGSNNIASLKQGILHIQNQANATSATQQTEGVKPIDNERKGLQAAKPESTRLGMDPGMKSGGVMGTKGIEAGFDSGMNKGAVFSSRRTDKVKKPAGEGLATKKVEEPKVDPTGVKKTTPGETPHQANQAKPDHKVNELNKSQEVSKTRQLSV